MECVNALHGAKEGTADGGVGVSITASPDSVVHNCFEGKEVT